MAGEIQEAASWGRKPEKRQTKMPVVGSAACDVKKTVSDSGVKYQLSPTDMVREIQTPGVLRGLLSRAIYNADVLEEKEGSNLSAHFILAVRQMPKYRHRALLQAWADLIFKHAHSPTAETKVRAKSNWKFGHGMWYIYKAKNKSLPQAQE